MGYGPWGPPKLDMTVSYTCSQPDIVCFLEIYSRKENRHPGHSSSAVSVIAEEYVITNKEDFNYLSFYCLEGISTLLCQKYFYLCDCAFHLNIWCLNFYNFLNEYNFRAMLL